MPTEVQIEELSPISNVKSIDGAKVLLDYLVYKQKDLYGNVTTSKMELSDNLAREQIDKIAGIISVLANAINNIEIPHVHILDDGTVI